MGYIISYGAEANRYAYLDGFNESPKFSLAERMSLGNQHRILAKLYPEDCKYHEERAEIFEQGYELLYTDYHINPIPVSEKVCNEVIDILLMFKKLKQSFDNLPDTDKVGINEQDILFQGFDGNGESFGNGTENDHGYFIFAEFYRKYKSNGSPLFGNVDFNSHRNMLSHYRKMLSRYRSVYNFAINLSKEEIMFICGGI